MSRWSKIKFTDSINTDTLYNLQIFFNRNSPSVEFGAKLEQNIKLITRVKRAQKRYDSQGLFGKYIVMSEHYLFQNKIITISGLQDRVSDTVS